MQTMQERPTMTVREAADLIGISLPSMYNITEIQSFTALLRVGRRKLILKRRFMEWLEAQAGQGKIF